MLGVARYHTIPLPKGWPRRVDELAGMDSHVRCTAEHQFLLVPRHRSGSFELSHRRVARRITPSRGRTWAFRRRLVSLDHYTR
jgi:hypothetical protein